MNNSMRHLKFMWKMNLISCKLQTEKTSNMLGVHLPEQLDKIHHPGYITNDKEQLKASEEKQRAKDERMKAKEEACKNKPNITKLQQQARKANRAQ